MAMEAAVEKHKVKMNTRECKTVPEKNYQVWQKYEEMS
jgi:hypothetical protein